MGVFLVGLAQFTIIGNGGTYLLTNDFRYSDMMLKSKSNTNGTPIKNENLCSGCIARNVHIV